MKPSQSEFVQIRSLRYHCRCWGEVRAPKLFMLHGWMDVSASFQFLVDALRRDWRGIAPDWRGFGFCGWGESDGYWVPGHFFAPHPLLEDFQPDSSPLFVGPRHGGDIAA